VNVDDPFFQAPNTTKASILNFTTGKFLYAPPDAKKRNCTVLSVEKYHIMIEVEFSPHEIFVIHQDRFGERHIENLPTLGKVRGPLEFEAGDEVEYRAAKQNVSYPGFVVSVEEKPHLGTLVNLRVKFHPSSPVTNLPYYLNPQYNGGATLTKVEQK